MNLNEEIMDKLTKVCICRGITRKTIKDAVKNGAKNFEDIKKITGAGEGYCKGNRCKAKIEEIINNTKGE